MWFGFVYMEGVPGTVAYANNLIITGHCFASRKASGLECVGHLN